jgi:hypothetical protein
MVVAVFLPETIYFLWNYFQGLKENKDSITADRDAHRKRYRFAATSRSIVIIILAIYYFFIN